ncbi:10323_t:CDS:2 [Funneliformis geosporum]|nr:10323_t:CDS:2 [Funneliformis geosporum]
MTAGADTHTYTRYACAYVYIYTRYTHTYAGRYLYLPTRACPPIGGNFPNNRSCGRQGKPSNNSRARMLPLRGKHPSNHNSPAYTVNTSAIYRSPLHLCVSPLEISLLGSLRNNDIAGAWRPRAFFHAEKKLGLEARAGLLKCLTNRSRKDPKTTEKNKLPKEKPKDTNITRTNERVERLGSRESEEEGEGSRFTLKTCFECGVVQDEYGFCADCRSGLVDQSLQIKSPYPRMSSQMAGMEEELALAKKRKLEQSKLDYDKLVDKPEEEKK